MEQKTPLLAIVPDTTSQIIALRCPDLMDFDPAPLNQLFSEKGPHEAEDVVCRALEDIANRLDGLQHGLVTCDFGGIAKFARRIGVVANQIGLTEVSVAAGHIITCVLQNDGVALEATMARLERAFDVAVSEVWNFRERDD